MALGIIASLSAAAIIGGAALGARALGVTDRSDASADALPLEVEQPHAPPNSFQEIEIPAVGGGTTTIEVEESIRRWADVTTLREVAVDGEVRVVLGRGQIDGDTCTIVRTAPGNQLFGCASADEIAQQGIILASRLQGEGLSGAFIAPAGVATATLNGAAIRLDRSGVLAFSLDPGVTTVSITADGPRGPIAHTLR